MKVIRAGQQISIPSQLLLDEASATVSYIGEAVPGAATSDAVWQIKRMTTTGGNIAIAWACDGLPLCKWDDRSTLDYA